MGHKGIRVHSTTERSSHFGQIKGSARKKANKEKRGLAKNAAAQAAGIDITALCMRRQLEVNQYAGNAWMNSYKPNDFVPQRRRSEW
jgi:hypothetical protein